MPTDAQKDKIINTASSAADSIAPDREVAEQFLPTVGKYVPEGMKKFFTGKNIRAPFQAYEKHVGSKPLLDAAVKGTALAGGGYLAGGALSKLLMGEYGYKRLTDEQILALPANKQEDALRKREEMDELERNGHFDKTKRLGALVGGGLGVAQPLANSFNSDLTAAGNLNKALDKTNFYKSNPHVLKSEQDKAKKNNDLFQIQSGVFDDGRSRNRLPIRDKYSNFSSFVHPNIPVNQAQSVIARDPFLTTGHKRAINGIIGGTPDGDSGMVSGQTLASTAVKAGFGALAGFAFGKAMGNLFDLPHAQVDKLSTYGAVATAVANTGILNREIGDIL